MLARLSCAAMLCAASLAAQVIEFESNGLKYQTLTKNGLTIMFAPIPSQLKGYSVLQVAAANGSKVAHTVDPEDFVFKSEDGFQVRAMPARSVVRRMLDKANRNDVIKLVGAYEIGLYGLARLQSTSGYEQRRQSAIAELGGGRLKAAAAASAIAFVKTKLNPGESTDGAVFYFPQGRNLGKGRVVVRAAGETFEFESFDLGRQ
jgi:hypothetical protein